MSGRCHYALDTISGEGVVDMPSYFRQKPPIWFWVVGVLLLLWGAQGVFACIQQFRFGAEAMGPATDYDRALFASLPGWYNWCFAVAVGAGFLGSLALLMRSAHARSLYIVSLIAVIVQFGYIFLATDLIAQKGAGSTLPFPIVITATAAFSIWVAGYATRRGWIG